MERTELGLVIDIDHINKWEEAELVARALLRNRHIVALERCKEAGEEYFLIPNALRRIAERTCTIHQAQRVLSCLMRCWDTICYNPTIWIGLSSGYERFNWKHLLAACKDLVGGCEECAAQSGSKVNGQVVRVRAKKQAAENPLKTYKVQVARTSYGELLIPAYNEDDAVAIASGEKRMYDGTWASEHFRPKSHDMRLEVCGDAVCLTAD